MGPALVDELLQFRVQGETTVALGEVHPGEALVELGAQELVPVRGAFAVSRELAGMIG